MYVWTRKWPICTWTPQGSRSVVEESLSSPAWVQWLLMNMSQVCWVGHISGLNGGWRSVWMCSWSREACTALTAGRAAIVLVKQPQGGCCCKNSISTGWSTWSQQLCAVRFPPRIITSYMVLSRTCKAAAAAQKHQHVSSFVFSRQIYKRHCWLNLNRKLLTEYIFVSVRLD